MIKITDLNVVLTDNTGSEVQGTGEMIVGTSPITKEVRDEELNLQNTPNFVISALIPNADVDVTENYNVSFDANEKHYSTVMTVMTKTNLRTGVKMNLQSTGAEIAEEDIVHEPVYSVHAFDKNDQEIQLNNIPAYQSGRHAVFDGAYLKCREDNSGEWVINPKLVYGYPGDPAITASQDAAGRSFFKKNLGAFMLDWSAFVDNNEQALTNLKVVISEDDTLFVPDSGEELTTFDITFVGHPESVPEPSYTYRFDTPENKTYKTSEDEGMVYVPVRIKQINENDQTETEIYAFPEGYSDSETPDPDYFLRLETGAEYEFLQSAGGFIDTINYTGNIPYEDDPMPNTIRLYNKNGEELTLQSFYIGVTHAPESHTLEFDSDNYATSYDIYTGEKSQARFNVLYDGTSIHLEDSMFNGLDYNKLEPIETSGGIFKAKDALPEISAGQTYVDNVTVTYEGLTASCTVTLTVTDSVAQDYTTKIKCNTSKGQFLVYSTDANDTIQTVQYDNYREVDMYYIDCSWSVETDNPEYQNLTYLQSNGASPFDNDNIRSNNLNDTVTGGFGGWDGEGNFVQIVDSLSVQVEYVVPTKRITCTTSRGEFAIYDSTPDSSTETIQYTDTFDKTFTDGSQPWVKTQLKYYVDDVQQNVTLQSDGLWPWDDEGNLRLGEEPSDMNTEYTVTGGLGYYDGDNFVEIAPFETIYKYMKVNPDYTWYVDGESNITPLATQNDSDISGIALTDNIDIYSDPDIALTNGNYDFHIESVGIMYNNENNLIECNSNSDVAFVFKDFADHSQDSNYEPVHFNKIEFDGINTAAANEIINKITTDEFGNTINWNNEEIPDVDRSILSCDLSGLDTIKMNLTPIIQQVGNITIETIQIVGLAGGL